jgi:hypothetical protein
MVAGSSDVVLTNGTVRGGAGTKRQVRGGPDPLDATLGRRDDLLQGVDGRVASSGVRRWVAAAKNPKATRELDTQVR